MKNEKNYFLGWDFSKDIEHEMLFQSLSRQFKRSGVCKVKFTETEVTLYTPELAFVLLSNKLKVTEHMTEKHLTINANKKFAPIFCQGFKDGQAYFEKEWNASINTLYGSFAEAYMADLLENHLRRKHYTIHEGWVFVRKCFPIVLNSEAVRKFGFYSGVVFKVEALKEKHPSLFATMEKNTPSVNEEKTGTKSSAFENKFDHIKPINIYEHFKAGLVDKKYISESDLLEYLKAAFEYCTPPKERFKLAHNTKQDIYKVFYHYYKVIVGKVHKRQTQYAALLGDYFEGFKTETVKTNWAREKSYK